MLEIKKINPHYRFIGAAMLKNTGIFAFNKISRASTLVALG